MLIKGRAEHPNGTVRFRPSAFKANLLLNLYERRKHLLTRVSSNSLDIKSPFWRLFCLEVISYVRFKIQWIGTAYCCIKP